MEVDEDAARLATLLVDYESRVFSATVDKYATNEQSRLALDVREWAESIGGTFTRTQFTRKFSAEHSRGRNSRGSSNTKRTYTNERKRSKRS